MASRQAIAELDQAARLRIAAAMTTLRDRLGVAAPPPPVEHAKQPELRAAWELERWAALLEAIIAALPDPAPAPKAKKS